jgi:hypothetical protein
MAFDATNISPHGITSGNKFLMYKSTDAIATVIASGYFNNYAPYLAVNDVICVVGSTGGTQTVDIIVVATISGSNVVTTINGT